MVHGNRLLESIIFSRIEDTFALGSASFQLAQHASAVASETNKAIGDLIDAISKRFPNSFLATVFKNPTKCSSLVSDCSKAKN